MTRSTDEPDSKRDVSVAGVLLAAGTSTEFGEENKLLVDLDGVPIVRRAAETLVASAVDPVVIIVGHEAERIRTAVRDLPIEVVENPAYRDGQSTSVRAGISAVGERAAAVVFALGDMPDVESASVDALIDAYASGLGDVLAAGYEGQRGNPVLFDARYFDELRDLEGDVGGREILLRDGTIVETGDPGVRRDIDDPVDVERASERSEHPSVDRSG